MGIERRKKVMLANYMQISLNKRTKAELFHTELDNTTFWPASDNSRLLIVVFSAALLGLIVIKAAHAGQLSEMNKSIIFRVVAPDGKPIQGAFIGTRAVWRDNEDIQQPPRISWVGYGTRPSRARATNEDGEGTIAGPHLFGVKADADETRTIVALHDERQLVGLVQVTSKDLGNKVEIPLKVGCRLKGRLRSKGLEKLGQSLKWTNVYVHLGDSRPFSCSSDYQRFEVLLPPGQYEIQAYGTGTEQIRQKMVIKTGEREKEIDIDLPVDVLTTLEGEVAPELRQIKGWKNGDPVKLSELHGKVVLLDFWGYWCFPCVRDMPKLMDLHHKYSDKGLLIIGLHDDSVDSIKELDSKISRLKEDVWNGRNIPFLIALDGGGRIPIKGTDRTALGATTAAYGIHHFPTTVVIDKKGRVVGDFSVNSPSDLHQLKVLLGLAEASSGYSSGDYDYFDPTIYKLQTDEVLKHIPPEQTKKRPFNGKYPFASFRWVHGKGAENDGPIFTHVTLENVVTRVLRLSKFEYECQEKLLSINVDGDWIIRHNATKHEKIQALNHIIRNELQLPISLVHRKEERDVVVARGRFKFQPLSGTHDDSQIHVYGETLNLEGRGFHSSGNLQQLLNRVSERIMEKQIINLVEPSPANDYHFIWLFHRPSSFIDGLSPEEKEKKVRVVLNNLSKHITLTFTQERRSVDVWYVTEESKDKR
jgi:thiol-disulfide isomerase/thioredoxin